MTKKRLSSIRTDPRRLWSDWLTRVIVSGGGLLVLLALLLMFFYLLHGVMPLFRSPSLAPAGPAKPLAARALALGGDNDLARAYIIDSDGVARFSPGDGEAAPPVRPLMADFNGLTAASGGQALYMISDRHGGVRLAQPLPATGRWAFPFGEGILDLDGAGRPLRQLALAWPDEDRAVAAARLAEDVVKIVILRPDSEQVRELRPAEQQVDSLLLSPDGQLLYLLAGGRLSLYDLAADGSATLRQRLELAQAGPVRLTLLPADGSLLALAGGRLSLWSETGDGAGRSLRLIRNFTPSIGENAQLLPLAQRAAFGVLEPDGVFSLFSAREPTPRLQTRLPAGALAAFSQRGDGLFTLDADGWRGWRLDVASPDISWRTLTQRVWYSQYPAPAWIWQPTSANGLDSGKFSLVPLLAGTLKAAGCAMLFATPLALGAALYTAWFMSPGLRRWVKPAMEIMGAVPSVIIGLIAGLWLAPQVMPVLSGLLLLPLALPAAVLLAGWGISRLAAGRGRPWSSGWDCLLLLPVTALTLWLLCRLAPLLDRLLFGEPMVDWLGSDYNPMNALVVGVAMGFALIPLIFSLAEEALFNVPVRLVQGSLALGATAWQTLIGVTLPAASAGLLSALVLGLGRAIGETMIVLMASGNMPRVDGSLFQGLRALAANIAIEIPEAARGGEHYRVLLLTALVLLVFTFIINTLAEALRLRLRDRYRQRDEEAG